LSASKFLAVNADDFGFTQDVNAGIIDAHRNGILTSTTLMANGDAFADAVRLAKLHPSLDVGCHLVLVGGQSLLSPNASYPATIGELVRALCGRRLRVEDELRSQIRRIFDAGITPSHIDTHKHTHLLPPVLGVVARLAREFGIPWVRRPFDLPLNCPPEEVPWAIRAANTGMQFLRRRFHAVLHSHGCRTTDYFAGFQLTGRVQSEQLLKLIHALPEGTTEFMCHPGHCRDELIVARTRLKESRERELEALVDPAVRKAIVESGVELRSFPDLP
jgi:predicted glycoside hydrolase/deacetylase ChbG (UPF0249 family)